jgi:hypothetical protein
MNHVSEVMHTMITHVTNIHHLRLHIQRINLRTVDMKGGVDLITNAKINVQCAEIKMVIEKITITVLEIQTIEIVVAEMQDTCETMVKDIIKDVVVNTIIEETIMTGTNEAAAMITARTNAMRIKTWMNIRRMARRI